ncbi:helix-turn-helix domain-containing protein [Rhodobium gokarnense]|uniref:Transcriptional regulator with XRE-family HTH domain n=1 Tax=Rhodobium gokarnense TaxID=364296 RepID=A0ABT3HCK9_9HYPH|nr:helix-turn-helix domain-containing protein [Rhodobium gokarnense]MCW2308128.1 transcriptional regulator with XRE-family HTH domain [Rhodobium gokarnense]
MLTNPDAAGEPEVTVGERIRRAREAMGLSAAQLARRLGIKTQTLTMWEGDRSEPRSNRLLMLAGLLNVSPSWLLSGLGTAPVGDHTASEMKTLRAELNLLKTEIDSLSRRLDKVITHFDRLVEDETGELPAGEE